MRAENLWHRASYIFIKNSEGKLYVQKRTMLKDYCPGYFDLSNGGVVGAEETDDENARRELEEELGISGVELKCIESKAFSDKDNRVWGNLYSIVYDGPVKL